MATRTEKLQIKIGAKNETGKVLSKIKNQVLGIGAAYLGFTAVSSMLKSIAREGAQHEKVWTDVAASLKRHGIEVDSNTAKIKRFADEMQTMTGESDEDFGKLIQTFVDYGQTVDESMVTARVAMDLAAGASMDLAAATDLIAKASVGYTGTLSRYGIIIDESLTKQEKFKAALELIDQRFGGAAQARAETYAVKIGLLSQRFGDLQEAIFMSAKSTGELDTALDGLSDHISLWTKFVSSDVSTLEVWGHAIVALTLPIKTWLGMNESAVESIDKLIKIQLRFQGVIEDDKFVDWTKEASESIAGLVALRDQLGGEPIFPKIVDEGHLQTIGAGFAALQKSIDEMVNGGQDQNGPQLPDPIDQDYVDRNTQNFSDMMGGFRGIEQESIKTGQAIRAEDLGLRREEGETQIEEFREFMLLKTELLELGMTEDEAIRIVARELEVENQIALDDELIELARQKAADQLDITTEALDLMLAKQQESIEKTNRIIRRSIRQIGGDFRNFMQRAVSDSDSGVLTMKGIWNEMGKSIRATFLDVALDALIKFVAGIFTRAIPAMVIEGAAVKLLTGQYIALAAAKSAASLGTTTGASLAGASATFAGLTSLMASGLRGFDDPANDFGALKSGRDYGDLFMAGVSQSLGSPGFGRQIVNEFPLGGEPAQGGSTIINININGPTNEAFIIDEVVPMIERLADDDNTTIVTSPDRITGELDVQFS